MPLFPEAISFQLRPVATLLRLGHGRDMFPLSTLAGTACVIADPALAREVLRAPGGVYSAGSANGAILPVLPKGTLLTLDGAEHRARRRALAPLFHGDALAAIRPAIRDIAATGVAAWPVDAPFAVLPRARFMTLRVATRLLLGVDDIGHVRRLERQLALALRRASIVAGTNLIRPRRLGRRSGSPCCPSGFARVLGEVRRGRSHTATNQPRDAVDVLRATAEQEDGRGEQALLDELFALLLAGHETTAAALAWALNVLAHQPAVTTALAEEAGADERPLLDAVIDEVLRLRPPLVDIVREVTGEAQLGTRELARGTLVLIPPP